MTSSHARSVIAALVAAGALAACSGTPRAAVQPAPVPAARDGADLAAIAGARADSARNLYTDADVRFMTAMIGHHAQAMVMAGWAPAHGAGPAVRRLAERIVSGQQDEIATMQRWLGDRRQPVPEADGSGMTMAGHGAGPEGHAMLMPGMLTEAQMRQLDRAKGSEFERLFLTFMIQHHRGAVTMVRELFGTTGAAQEETVFKFANDVSADQSSEIARMETMLATLTPGRTSP